MTPAARIAAAIGLLDTILSGAPAEQVLTAWARRNRYAGSSDRAVIRDHVYDAIRCLKSFAAMGGLTPGQRPNGRQLMIGALRASETPLDAIFTGTEFSPDALNDAERAAIPAYPELQDLPDLVALDCPGWLEAPLREALGADFAPVMALMRERAPTCLRANLTRASREDARSALAAEGIVTEPHRLADTALLVSANAQRIRASAPYLGGLVELQDAASQAATAFLPLAPGQRVLDFCAGGGGKTLAMAGRCPARYFAHDAAPARMRDLLPRAERAHVTVAILTEGELERAPPFDLVLVDAPCSGSGTWRRAPEPKWTLTPARLSALVAQQYEILVEAASHVVPEGALGYMTCSLLNAENQEQIGHFLLDHPGWSLLEQRRFTPLDGGDGFFVAVLRRS